MDDLDRMIEQKLEEKNAPKEVQVQEKPIQAPSEPRKVQNVNEATDFTKAVEVAKLQLLNEAAAKDERFIKEVQEEVKKATVKLAEVEKDKAELEQKNIQFEQELKDKDRQLNEFEKQRNYWKNRQDRRQYHYDGVKPIMEFVGIKSPMNLILLYFLVFVITPFFLLYKLFQGTVGALVAGAEDSNRPKAMKGFIWTILGLLVAAVVAFGIILALKWCGVIDIGPQFVQPSPVAEQVVEQVVETAQEVVV